MRISDTGIEITKRYFEALEHLKATKRIKSISSFTDEYNINRWNMMTVKNNPSTSVLKPEWLAYIIKYGVSPTWLLTGKGNIFLN